MILSIAFPFKSRGGWHLFWGKWEQRRSTMPAWQFLPRKALEEATRSLLDSLLLKPSEESNLNDQGLQRVFCHTPLSSLTNMGLYLLVISICFWKHSEIFLFYQRTGKSWRKIRRKDFCVNLCLAILKGFWGPIKHRQNHVACGRLCYTSSISRCGTDIWMQVEAVIFRHSWNIFLDNSRKKKVTK